MVDGFHHCPLVIRRQHIEEFWEVPAENRQEFFFDYLREDFGNISDPRRVQELEGELEALEKPFEKARAEYAYLARCALGALSDAPSLLRFMHRRQTSLLIRAHERAEAKEPNRRSKSDRAAMERSEIELQDAFDRLIIAAERRAYVRGQLGVARDSPGADLSGVTALLRQISQAVTDDFSTISGVDWISSIEMSVGDGTDFSIMVETRRGESIDPTQVLSEAALDLLAVLILTEMQVACQELGQNPVIVYDDVFQSVDTVNRTRTLDHLARRLQKWQIVVILHDRMMLNLVANAFRRNGIEYQSREILRGGNSLEPPRIRNDTGSAVQRLRSSLDSSHSPPQMCAAAGVALEEMLNALSVALQTSVTRRRDDLYTLGDLWPGVYSTLRKSADGPAASIAETVDQFIVLRNLAGAHYNDWAQGIASQEAIDFAAAVLELHDATFCRWCSSPIAKFRAALGNRIVIAFPCKCQNSESERITT